MIVRLLLAALGLVCATIVSGQPGGFLMLQSYKKATDTLYRLKPRLATADGVQDIISILGGDALTSRQRHLFHSFFSSTAQSGLALMLLRQAIDFQLVSRALQSGGVSTHGLSQALFSLHELPVKLAKQRLQGHSAELDYSLEHHCGVPLSPSSSFTCAVGDVPLQPCIRLHTLLSHVEQCARHQGLFAHLAEQGAQLHVNSAGYHAVHSAVWLGPGVLDAVLSASPDYAHSPTVHTGLSPLHLAAAAGCEQCVQMLLRAGADGTAVDLLGRTPEDVAVEAGADLGCIAELRESSRWCSTRELCEATDAWHAADAVRGDDGECPGMDTVSASDLTPEVLQRYVALNKPLRIRYGHDQASTPSFDQVTRELLESFAELEFKRVETPYADAFGVEFTRTGSRSTTLGDFLTDTLADTHADGPPLYIFDELPASSPLLSWPRAQEPGVFSEMLQMHGSGADRTMQFFIGGTFTGASPHFHRATWNRLVAGRKQWRLWHPSHAFFSNAVPASVFSGSDHTYTECVQRAGDVMFVPDQWGHAILNTEPSVGFASEFSFGHNE